MPASVSLADHADAIEEQKIRELDALVLPSALFTMVEGARHDGAGAKLVAANPGKYMMMGDDPRLPKMPEKPTLIDFFKLRFRGGQHLLQSAHHAQKAGYDEKVVLACLLHDIAVVGLIRGDHGYWGAQLVEPYVEPEVSWAIRTHQALRFYPDESVGYAYPEMYHKLFGPNYRPDPYIEDEYRRARGHKWYMTSRLICVSDIYSFDPSKQIQIEEFADVIGRNFRQPKEGLGYDGSPVAHMWRAMIRPTKFL
ncbi:MAG TPA: HD domain-containing protein [Stellaceae bacterium]|nr:HD domain-containing protein [Stellaceae bacterium]